MVMQLREGWFLQSAEAAGTPGEKLSMSAYRAKGWIPAVVPGTVVGGMVKAGVLDDPMISTTMEAFEGFKGGNEKLHTLMPLPDDSPYRRPWWFRTVFTYRKPASGKRVWLELEGVSYRGDVWLNGTRVGTAAHVTGIFKRVAIDVTRYIQPGENCLAIELTTAGPDDFGHTWIDWAPEPPDNSMGIIQPVRLRETGPVVLKHPFVQTDLDVETFAAAALTVRGTLENTADEPATVTLEAKIGPIIVSEKVTLAPWEQREVVLCPENHRKLIIKNPRVWQPWQWGRPEMYAMTLTARVGTKVSDRAKVSFGIRKITSRLNAHGARVFTVNGRDMLIRGSAWSPDLFLGQSRTRDELAVAYVKNMNLNAIRLEGTPVSEDFWDVCNREGVLVLHGITCVNYWEHSQDWREEDYSYARESVRSLFSSIRNHPCLMGFMIASDFPTVPKAEAMYLNLLEEMPIDVPVTANSATKYSPQMGPTGMIHGPYDFVPPVFWYKGGAVRFNTEVGPDICLPLNETLERIFPAAGDRKVRSHAWNMHCGLQLFTSTISGDKALTRRYGVKERNLADFVDASQVMGYECWRAMYEAWVREYPKATGVIGWMLNSCWTSLMWQMYDYDNNPLGAFYGTQKACEPLHVQYSYDDHSIWVVNQTSDDSGEMKVCARVCDLAGVELWSKAVVKAVGANGRARCFAVSDRLDLPEVYFLVLELRQGRKLLSRNVYWLTRESDQVNVVQNVDQKAMERPQKAFADFKALGRLPEATVETDWAVKKVGRRIKVKLSLANAGDTVAFFLWPRLVERKTGRPVTPVCWSENCVTLMPGESVTLSATAGRDDLDEKDLTVRLCGWHNPE